MGQDGGWGVRECEYIRRGDTLDWVAGILSLSLLGSCSLYIYSCCGKALISTMGISAFCLPLYLPLVFLPPPAVAAAQSYLLDTSYSNSTFFNGWDFFTVCYPINRSTQVADFSQDADLTHGFVQYVSQADALTAGLISQGFGPAYMGVDYSTTLSISAQGRKSVRITTQKSWTHELFIGDIEHMPDSTCGVWPACMYSGMRRVEVISNWSSLDVWSELAY